MPFSFRIEDGKEWYSGNLAIRMFSISFIDKEKFEVLNRIINQINVVVNAIIPELNIKLRNYSLEISENGKEGFRVELLSSRKNIEIPLKYESYVVKKIVSILSALIAMYNNEQILLAIDELDAGIYEFLLGEILEVVSENAKGQFIFTSHNLRALEKLDKDCIVFTTTNPNNRYITMENVGSTNNLRDVYLKSILLGCQKETIYESSNKFEISYAFRTLPLDDQTKSVKYNDLLANIVILQNTIDMENVVKQLKNYGIVVSKQDIKNLSSYLASHIKRFGEYIIDLDGEDNQISPLDIDRFLK